MGRRTDPSRRRRYLGAMGIRVWRLRGGDGVGPEASLVGGSDLVERGAAGRGVPDKGSPAWPADSPVGLQKEGGIESDSPSLGTGSGSAPIAGEAAAPEIELAGADSRAAQRVLEMDWGSLRKSVEACRACGLHQTRTRTVFGVGNRDADLMVIGEAPGADEDRQGEPFVGRAGQLLDLMLESIGLTRDQVYIANILKCRPPGNRDPRPEESSACRTFLLRQIALTTPRVILAVGRVSAQNLLETDDAVGRLRGRWFEFGDAAVPLTVTYHPSYLLRSPEQKAKAWEDLQRVARGLRGE